MERKCYPLKTVSLTDYEISLIIGCLKGLVEDCRKLSSQNKFWDIFSCYAIEHAETIIKKLEESEVA